MGRNEQRKCSAREQRTMNLSERESVILDVFKHVQADDGIEWILNCF